MSDGNDAQLRVIANQIADDVALRFIDRFPSKVETSIPSPLKWGGGFALLLGGAAVVGYFNWLTTTVSQMQSTLVRIEVTQARDASENSRRIEALEKQNER